MKKDKTNFKDFLNVDYTPGEDEQVKLNSKKRKRTSMEDVQNESSDSGLAAKAKKSGMPLSVLKQVYRRGVAAWNSGHRPGTTPQQWGMARVNSFVTKSSGTWGKADKDLAAKVRKEEVELDEGILKPYHAVAQQPWSKSVKDSKGTAGEYKQIGKGKNFTVWTAYRGSNKSQPHYVVRDDKVIGSGMAFNSALKDAKVKEKDVTHRSKFADGSILNKGMKEEVEKTVSEAEERTPSGRMGQQVHDYKLKMPGRVAKAIKKGGPAYDTRDNNPHKQASDHLHAVAKKHGVTVKRFHRDMTGHYAHLHPNQDKGKVHAMLTDYEKTVGKAVSEAKDGDGVNIVKDRPFKGKTMKKEPDSGKGITFANMRKSKVAKDSDANPNRAKAYGEAYRKPTQAEIDADKKKENAGKKRPSMDYKSAKKSVYKNMMGGLKTEDYKSEYAHHTQGLEDAKADIKAAKTNSDMVKAMNKKAHHSKALSKMNRMESVKEVELEEATMSRVAKELEAYAQKNGGIDKMDFMKAAMMMKRGQTGQLKKFVDELDTEPREKILSLMQKDADRRKEYKAAQRKMREEVELDEGAKEKALKALMTKALGGKRAKPGYTSAVANNGDFVVKDGGGRVVGRLKSGSYTDPLKESVELDEVLDRPGALDSYRKKADASGNKARNSATRKILQGPDKDGKRADHSDELKTMKKRNKGQDMADKVANKLFRKSIGLGYAAKKEEVESVAEGAYLKGSIESRADAHEDQADHHNSQAEKAHKAGDKMAASAHKAAARAHMKAASYFDKHLSKPKHLRPQAAGGATSQAAHAATQKANQYNESTKPDAAEVMRKQQQMANISTSDKDKLAKIRAMLNKEKKK